MGLRFRKSIKAGPLRINLSKSGIGYSVGSKGFRYTKKATGGTRRTASIPGTGISYVTESGNKKRGSNMPQLNNMPSKPQKSAEVFTETFRPVNISPEEVKKLAHLNPEWKLSDMELLSSCSPGQKIYQVLFTTKPVQLVQETNGAIAIVVAGHKIGCVGEDATTKIAKVLNAGNIKNISCGIFGGQYKVINDDHTISQSKVSVTIFVRVSYTLDKMSQGRQRTSRVSTKTELILAILLGWAGVHKFYRKRIGMGILYLLTCGLFCVGWLGDAIQLTLSYFSKGGKTPLSKFQKIASYVIAAVLALSLGSCGGNSQVDTSDVPTNPDIATNEVVENEETVDSIVSTTVPTETVAPTETPTQAPTDPPETEPPTQPPTEPKETESKEKTYVLNTSTQKFHSSGCREIKKMKSSNKKEFKGTRDEVIKKGYSPCGVCHP